MICRKEESPILHLAIKHIIMHLEGQEYTELPADGIQQKSLPCPSLPEEQSSQPLWNDKPVGKIMRLARLQTAERWR
jgi:hypothetical protein